MFLGAPTFASATNQFAVWLNGQATDGGNPIPNRLNIAFGAGAVTLVSTAQLETPGFLDSFDCVVISRFDASFGNYLSALATSNIAAYVGSGASQGGVAVFTNDMADNLQGGPDPFDPNLDALFINAATFAAASHHGFIGEFNGAVMAMAANTAGVPAIGLLPGTASATYGYGPQFVYDVGPIGASNPIDAAVTFPFTDADTSTFRTDITGADSSNIVDVYNDNGLPAVLGNTVVISGGGSTTTTTTTTTSSTTTTTTIPSQNKCPLSQGFWRTHPAAWSVTSLTLGSQTYTQAELLTILTTPVGSSSKADASLILADQLIAAKLNIANGSDPTPVASTIADADALLATFTGKLRYGVRTNSATGLAMVNDASMLGSYNNGALTPSCVR